jgi:transcriptional regulator with XRE-family HTH domain
MTPGQLLREARVRHGLSQERLARRARTSQAAISRIERDVVSPTIATLSELIDHTGEELVLSAQENDWGHDRTLRQANLQRSPLERLERAVSRANFYREFQGVAQRRG